MAPTPDGMSVTPENAQEVGQRDELKNYTKEELMMLAEAKDETSDSKESKETFVKSLEFEPDTFKIDSRDWKTIPKGDKFNYLGARNPKVNATGDIVEFQEGPSKGEQIFITYDAFIREVMKAKNCTQEEVEAKYLMTVAEFKEKIKDKPEDSEEYKKFFSQELNGSLPGLWDSFEDAFCCVNNESYVWLVDGIAEFCRTNVTIGYKNSRYGCSGRLLKN